MSDLDLYPLRVFVNYWEDFFGDVARTKPEKVQISGRRCSCAQRKCIWIVRI